MNCDPYQSAAKSSNNAFAAAIPSGTYSASSRSLGECRFESGSEKPVMTVGIPLVRERGHDR